MNRTIKGATVQRDDDDSHRQLERHLTDFVAAQNFRPRLKTHKRLTPYQAICKARTSQPEWFAVDRLHQIPGPST